MVSEICRPPQVRTTAGHGRRHRGAVPRQVDALWTALRVRHHPTTTDARQTAVKRHMRSDRTIIASEIRGRVCFRATRYGTGGHPDELEQEKNICYPDDCAVARPGAIKRNDDYSGPAQGDPFTGPAPDEPWWSIGALRRQGGL